MKNALLYADDPGGANYLAALPDAITKAGVHSHFFVAPYLEGFARDRGYNASPLIPDVAPETLLADIDLLLVGTSDIRDCYAHRLTTAAKSIAIPSVGVVDMAVNAEHRFCGTSSDPLRYAPDWLILPDKLSVDIYNHLGFRDDRIALCGHPHYDIVRNRKTELQNQNRKRLRDKVFPAAPTNRPIWLFLAEGRDVLNPHLNFRTDDYTLHGRGDSNFRACILLEEVVDIGRTFTPQPWIALRPHPKSDLQDFAPILADVDNINQGGDPLEAIWSADLIIGMATMLLMETLLLGRPHVGILPRVAETYQLVTLQAGVSPVATTQADLRHLLTSPPAINKSAADSLLPPGALNRVIAIIKTILSLPN
ncbi:MAG: hypothetical protein JXQ84_09435 [Rhodospirillaceae bacterium]|nr:hypothetical protein [Rhodospirillaceae bacterium]